jgi:hypothetical protein
MAQLIKTKYESSSYSPGLALKFAGEVERISNLLKQAIEESGKDVLDVLKTLILIDGLPEEFEVLKQLTLMDDELDFAKAKEAILQKDQRLQFEHEGKVDPSLSAFSSRSSPSPKKLVKCNYCHKDGHIESECRRKKRDQENANENGTKEKGREGKGDTVAIFRRNSGAMVSCDQKEPWFDESM